MLEIGKTQTLKVIKKVDFGVYLAEDTDDAKNGRDGEVEKVLLPKSKVRQEIEIGDKLAVFLYKDSKDRLIATVNTPALQLHEVAKLTVASVTGIGAFLNWGLEKDLFLPFHEQTYRVKPGDEVLVALYVDKSSRLCATMKVYHYLGHHLKQYP